MDFEGVQRSIQLPLFTDVVLGWVLTNSTSRGPPPNTHTVLHGRTGEFNPLLLIGLHDCFDGLHRRISSGLKAINGRTGNSRGNSNLALTPAQKRSGGTQNV